MGNIFVNDIKLNSGQSGVYYGEAILGYNFELRPYEIDIDELISLLILKEENLISIFDLGVVDQSIFRRLIHSKFKSYFNDGTFDFDSVNKIIYEEVSKDEANEENELIESINAEITRKKSFYSFLAEALQYIIISEISNTEVKQVNL